MDCISTSALDVTVQHESGGQTTVRCTDGTTTHTFAGFTGELTCIDPAVYCAAPKTASGDPSEVPGMVWMDPLHVVVSSLMDGAYRAALTPCHVMPVAALLHFAAVGVEDAVAEIHIR